MLTELNAFVRLGKNNVPTPLGSERYFVIYQPDPWKLVNIYDELYGCMCHSVAAFKSDGCTHGEIYGRLLAIPWGQYHFCAISLPQGLLRSDGAFREAASSVVKQLSARHIVALRDGYLDRYEVTIPRPPDFARW